MDITQHQLKETSLNDYNIENGVKKGRTWLKWWKSKREQDL